jgi:hypothetical protein
MPRVARKASEIPLTVGLRLGNISFIGIKKPGKSPVL